MKAFYNCTNLKSITVPESVIEIRDLAFAGCTSLSCAVILNLDCEIDESAF